MAFEAFRTVSVWGDFTWSGSEADGLIGSQARICACLVCRVLMPCRFGSSWRDLLELSGKGMACVAEVFRRWVWGFKVSCLWCRRLKVVDSGSRFRVEGVV